MAHADTHQESAGLVKTMRWYDGVAMSLTMPAALIAALGYSIGALGAWAALTLWGVSMLLATIANWIYSEMAAMYPDTPGGIALYANEGWKKHGEWIGPLAAFGYWFAWTTSIAVYAGIIGSLVQAQWFPTQDWAVSLGPLTLNFPLVFGALVIVLLYAANMRGLRLTLSVIYVTAAVLLIPLLVFIVLPYFTGDWQASRLSWNLEGEGSIRTALVWLYIMAWTSFGVEVCATFAPEYRDSVKDTSRALRTAALLSLAIFVLLPLGVTGQVGEQAIADDPATFYVGAFEQLVGGASSFMVVCIIASLLLIMVTALADGSRVLYGMGLQGMTLRQFAVLNKRGIPARALTFAVVLNIAVLFLLKNTLAIIATGNLGYILAHVFALSAFLLLRRQRPDLPRPIRLPNLFVPVAGALAVFMAVTLVVGATGFSTTGYGGTKELFLALAVLATSILMWLYRKHVQDRAVDDHADEVPTETTSS